MECVEIASLGRITQPLVRLGTPACRVELLCQNPHCRRVATFGGRAQQPLEIIQVTPRLLDLPDRKPQSKVVASVASPLPPLLGLLGPASLVEPPSQHPHAGGTACLDIPAQQVLSFVETAGVVEPL